MENSALRNNMSLVYPAQFTIVNQDSLS